MRSVGMASLAEVAQRLTVRYESVIVGEFVADLIVNDQLLCELKAISCLSKADELQLVNYLVATNNSVGLLINFASPSLQSKRKHRRLASDPQSVDLWNPVNPV